MSRTSRLFYLIFLSILFCVNALELTPKQRAMLSDAETYSSQTSFAKAAKLYRKLAIQCESDYNQAAHFYFLHAENLFFANKTYKAMKAYKELISTYKIVIPLEIIFERLRQLANNFEDGKGTFLGLTDSTTAIEIYRFIIQETPSARASLDDRYTLTHKLVKEGRANEAVNAYQDIIKLLPDEDQARYELAKLLNEIAMSNHDGDGRIAKAAARAAQAYLDMNTGDSVKNAEMLQVRTNARESEARRLLALAEYYLQPRRLKASAARRYLHDIQRDYSDTSAAVRASHLIMEHFPEPVETTEESQE